MRARKIRLLEGISILLFAIPLYFICFWFALLRGKLGWTFIDRMVDDVYDVMLEWRIDDKKGKMEQPRFVDENGHEHRHRRGHRGGRKHKKHFH